VLVCLPDVKDVEGGLRALGDRNVIAVRAGESYLEYSGERWPIPLLTAAEAFRATRTIEGCVLALGTMTFVGDVLDYLDVPCDVAYDMKMATRVVVRRRGQRG
jgi:hypothetical protein